MKPLPGACPPPHWSNTTLHEEQNNWPSSTWNVPSRIISCPVIRSNIYREMRSCFWFRRNTRHFHNKLIHGVFCLALNERSYILQATIKLFLPRYLCWKKAQDKITSPENISTIVNGPLTQRIVYSLPISNRFYWELVPGPWHAKLRIEGLFDWSNARGWFWWFLTSFER